MLTEYREHATQDNAHPHEQSDATKRIPFSRCALQPIGFVLLGGLHGTCDFDPSGDWLRFSRQRIEPHRARVGFVLSRTRPAWLASFFPSCRVGLALPILFSCQRLMVRIIAERTAGQARPYEKCGKPLAQPFVLSRRGIEIIELDWLRFSGCVLADPPKNRQTGRTARSLRAWIRRRTVSSTSART